MEDSRNALFVEPGAYVQHHTRPGEEKKKIIFQEPYESIPRYYPKQELKPTGDCGCIHKKGHKTEQKKTFFDIKSLMPLLGALGQSGGGFNSVTNILSCLSRGDGGGNIIKSLMSNPDMITNISKMFFKSKSSEKKDSYQGKKSDIEIRNYTKVD